MTVRRMGVGLAGVLLAAAAAGCSGSEAVNGPTTLPTGTCPQRGSANAAIDYVSFVMHRGRMFSATSEPVPLPETLVGPQVGAVTCRIADTRISPYFRYRDGDSSYLSPGTAIHRVVGYRETFRLAAKGEDGSWQLFELSVDDAARTGADLLDLSPGVTAVRLLDPATGATSTSLDDPAAVRRLVTALLASRAVTEESTRSAIGDESPQQVRFELADGTAVERVWYRTAGYLGFQLVAPPELAAAFPA